MIDLDELKARINPTYAHTLGTESYERRLCVEEIERLRARVAELEELLQEAYADADDVLRPYVKRLEEQLAAMTKERDYQKRLADETNKGLTISEADYRELEKRFNELAAKYDELLYAVGNKWPNETRHQTALRYIRAMESQANAALAKLGADKTGE